MSNGSADKMILLTSASNLLYQKVETLWDTYSGIPELLNAQSTSGVPSRKYKFSSNNDEYFRTRNGQYITDDELRKAIRKISYQTSLEMRKKTQQLISGIIIASVWYLDMQDLMTVLYKTIWLLSIGGFLFDDNAQRNAFYLFVLGQFQWIDRFHDQILDKSQPLDGTALTRAGLYGSYGNPLWQNILLERRIEFGYTEARRVLGKNENHCHSSHSTLGCIELASKGWQPIQQIVPLGQASCYSNCLCQIIYR